MGEPQKQTFTNVTPIAASTPQTFSEVMPIGGPPDAGWMNSSSSVRPLLKDTSLHVSNPATIPNARIRNVADPSDPNAGAWNLYEGAKTGAELGSIPATIGQPLGTVARGAIGAALGSTAGRVGATVLGAGDRGQEVAGDIGGAAGAGFSGSRGGRFVQKVGQDVAEDIPGVRTFTRLADLWKQTAPPEPPVVNPGAPYPETPPRELTQASALYRGSGSPPDPAAGLGRIKSGAIADAFKDPGAPFPETPDPALLKARSLFEGSSSPPDPAAGLYQPRNSAAGQMVDSVQKPVQTSAPARGSLSQMMNDLQDQVGKGLGASPPPNPKAPIYQRGGLSQAVQEGASDMPQGHTPHQSSALRSSMYDPDANEFHARMTSGDTTYVYGDVSPDEARAFSDAKSKGQAYQQIKGNHPLVAKIVNGKRMAVKATQ